MRHYTSYRAAVKSRFGRPVVKIAVNGGFSCPNRDGTKSGTGCVFCDNRSFSPVSQIPNSSATEQLRTALARPSVAGRPVIAYLQPFSNTYATVERLRSVYEPILLVPGVVGLAIGTRPDCFSEEIHGYLSELSRRTCLSVELGVQSSHDDTLLRCNRGHSFEDFTRTVVRLSAEGIETVAHVILGLPGENLSMMRETARRLADLPCTGVKIHQLMIIEGTECAAWYREGKLRVFTLTEYAEVVTMFLSHLRPEQHIHRIVADSTRSRGLIAPLWSADKSSSLNAIHRYMDRCSAFQGSNRK